MSNELNVNTGIPGLTMSAILIVDNAVVGSPISCPESGTKPGFYSGNMAGAADFYNIVFQDSTGREWNAGTIDWDGSKEVTFSVLAAILGETAGVGPFTITVTVTDGSSNPIPNAAVSLNSGLSSAGFAKTNSSGVAQLFCNSGSYEIVVTAATFNGNSLAITVTGNQSAGPIVLSQFTPAVSGTGLVTGYLTCYDSNGNPVSGVSHVLTIVSLPQDAVGLSIDNSTRTVTSGSGPNNVQFPDMVPHGVYDIVRDNGTSIRIQAEETDFPIQIVGGPN